MIALCWFGTTIRSTRPPFQPFDWTSQYIVPRFWIGELLKLLSLIEFGWPLHQAELSWDSISWVIRYVTRLSTLPVSTIMLNSLLPSFTNEYLGYPLWSANLFGLSFPLWDHIEIIILIWTCNSDEVPRFTFVLASNFGHGVSG